MSKQRSILEIPGYQKVYRALSAYGESGATTFEIGKALPAMKAYQVTSKLRELERHRKVSVAGVTRDRDRVATGTGASNIWVAVADG